MIALPEFWTSANTMLFFGIAAGVLSAFAYIPYILDTVTGRTQPQRASWLIWSVLGSVALVSQIYEGATSSLWFAGMQVSCTIVVFVLSIKTGKGRYLSKADYSILMAAALGLVLWYFTETATYALAITISISLLGGTATVVKAYTDPDSETLVTWVISWIASACAIFSVGKYDLILLAYPLYLFTLYLAFIVAIALGRLKKSNRIRTRAVTASLFSLAPARSILRTTADTIIVCTAAVFALDWLNNSENSTTTPEMFLKSSMLSSTMTATDRPFNNNFEAITPLPLFSQPQPNRPGQPSSSSASAFQPHTLEVTLRLNDGGSNQVWKMEDNDPLTEKLLDRVTGLLVEKGDLLSNKQLTPAVSTIALESKVTPTPLRLFDKQDAGTQNKIPQINRPPVDLANFQFLDSYDPFTQLTVANTNARLFSIENEQTYTILPHGTALTATATDGEWFRVRTKLGKAGYVSHADVSVNELAMLVQ